PNRRGFLHRTVSKPPRPRLSVALQPIPPRGRGASDTVLGNIGSHVDITSWWQRHQAGWLASARRGAICSGLCRNRALKASKNVYFDQCGGLNALEVYKRETEEVLKRFRAKRLTLSECIACLISALDGFDPATCAAQRESLRTWAAANNEEVTKVLARQGLSQYVQ
ncbi:MAG: hypothetical protein WBW33_08530, partial [Bryobacteraceae bacterium]